ncbi:MAG: signal peptide peptidase SppA [Fidelibacterota bacterium]
MGQIQLNNPRAITVNRGIWLTVGVILLAVLLTNLFSRAGSSDGLSLGPKVGLIHLEGPIFSSEPTLDDFKELSDRYDIKAFVLRINSPGGAVAPSQELFEKVKAVNAHIPVVVSIGTVAASGGYYAAVGSQRIVANPGSITGSIGVIMDYPVVTDLMGKVGVKIETVKSGSLKDAGSPTREVTEADRAYFKDIITDMHQQFISAVAEQRKLDPEQVKTLADGRVFTGRQAVELGLVDTLGTLEDAIAIAAQFGGISGTPKTAKPRHRKSSILDWVLEEGETAMWPIFNRMPAFRWYGRE